MRSSYLTAALFGAAFAASPVMAQQVPVDKLDKKVVQAIESRFKDPELLSATRETDDGVTEYEVKIRLQGEVWEVDVAENGNITEVEPKGKQ